MMKRYKKAQGLSLNMVAVGVISITLLVIVVTIFITTMDKNRTELEKKTEGKECSGKTDINGVEYKYFVMSYKDCYEKGKPAIGTFVDPSTNEPIDTNVETCCLVKS